MGYKRKYNHSHNNKRRKSNPKLAIAGAIILVIGILVTIYIGIPASYDQGKLLNPILITGFLCGTAGTVMLLFSLNKRNQRRLVGIIDYTKEAFREKCNCCKCQNCGRNHNHWTHD